MRTRRLVAWLIICLALLTGCTEIRMNIAVTTEVPGTQHVLPELSSESSVAVKTGSVLYFRYLDEPYLAPETRTVQQFAGQTYEYALISALIGGHGTHAASLNDVFPEGVRLLSTVKQERLLFVTLSAEIMNDYADEPDSWQADDYWRREVPLRRRLCMQSIVATVTENCDVDRVQILVQDNAATGSLRLKQNYFKDDSEDDVLVGPMYREEELLLGQTQTLKTVFTYWKQNNWQRLYRYLFTADQTDYEAFVETMEKLPIVLEVNMNGGEVTVDGAQATFTVRAVLLRDGAEENVYPCVMHLGRENGIWKIHFQELISWLEEDAA